ncbi:uncharacterized protein LOC126800631 [Argentina anserina]|uniref:uncharacterized protein LOC126800631 n=1 Tax=Argentina anserina TaxID=57926 RepID=UPI0021765B67|nr:uncharacterized protein LOC126800631 [Potentilla anserina]
MTATADRVGPVWDRVRAGLRELEELARGQVEARAAEIAEDKRRLKLLELRIDEKNREVCAKEERIEELESSARNADVKLREERLRNLEELSKKCDEEVRLKKGRIHLIQKSMVQCSNTLEARERKIRELELIEERVRGCIGEAEVRAKDLDSVEKSMREERVELDLARKALEEREKSLELLGERLEHKATEIELRERQVEGINARLSEVELREKMMESVEKTIQKDKKHLEVLQNSVAAREEQLISLQRSVQDRENNLFLLQTSVHERERDLDTLSNGLERRERELEMQSKELELKQQQFDSQRTGKQVEPTLAPNNVTAVTSTSDQSQIMDGRSLQLFMNEQVAKIDLAGGLVLSVLQASPDPARLVLDAMRGFYPSNPIAQDKEFESQLRVVRKSCILLLQELRNMSPLIIPQVREEAGKLAADWEQKMVVDDSWEALVFLRLITTYELTSLYDLRELRSLLAMVSQPEQAAELSRELGITDETPVANVISSIVKTERSESLLPRDEATLSASNNQIQNENIVSLPSIVKIERPESSLARNVATLSSPNNYLLQSLLITLQSSSDPSKLVLDMVQRSFTYYSRNRNVGSKGRVVSSNISLLKMLLGLSTHVVSHLKEYATNVASQWKAQLIADTEESEESLGYLLFIAVYGLLATLHEDEIVMLLRRLSQHKQSLKLCRTHPFADYIPG